MSVKQRIREFVQAKSMAISAFEKSIGTANGYVNSITKSIGIDKLELIFSTYPELDLVWLLTGTGSMLKPDFHNDNNNPGANDKKNKFSLTNIEAILQSVKNQEPTDTTKFKNSYVIPEFSEQGAQYLFRVSGATMYPKYSNGDLLACRAVTDPVFIQWGKVYVLNTSQGTLVNLIYPHESDPDLLWCKSENTENYPSFTVHKKDILHIAIVVGVLRTE